MSFSPKNPQSPDAFFVVIGYKGEYKLKRKDSVVQHFSKVSQNVALFSTDIGPLLGGRIHQELHKEVHPALDQVLNMAGGKTPLN